MIILLVAKKYLSPSGNVNITVNGDRVLNVPQGNNLMATLNENGIFLPSACGGKASCGQCKVQVLEGGGEILDSERPHFSRKEIKAGWRLGCQCKVKDDLKIHVDESILGVKEYDLVFVIANEQAWNSFTKDDWKVGGSAEAAANDGEDGASLEGATVIDDGLWVYQITKKGLALDASIKGTNIYPDKKLNDVKNT